MSADKDEEVQERDEFRKDRAKERQRERNIARAAPDKRFVTQKVLVICARSSFSCTVRQVSSGVSFFSEVQLTSVNQ